MCHWRILITDLKLVISYTVTSTVASLLLKKQGGKNLSQQKTH